MTEETGLLVEQLIERLQGHADRHEFIYSHRGICGEAAEAIAALSRPQPAPSREALREALEKIAAYETKCVMPWTHEIAADVYSADLDRVRHIAKAALTAQAHPAVEGEAAWDDGKSYGAVQAKDRIRLWFFRDISSAQRLKLFSLFEMPIDEIGEIHGYQKLALKRIIKQTHPAPASDVREAFAWRHGVLREPLRRALMAADNLLGQLEAQQDNTGEDLEPEDQAVVHGAKSDMAYAKSIMKRADALAELAQNDFSTPPAETGGQP